MGGPNATPTAETKASQTKRPSRIALPPERVAVCGRRSSYAYATGDGRGAEQIPTKHFTRPASQQFVNRQPTQATQTPQCSLPLTAWGIGLMMSAGGPEEDEMAWQGSAHELVGSRVRRRFVWTLVPGRGRNVGQTGVPLCFVSPKDAGFVWWQCQPRLHGCLGHDSGFAVASNATVRIGPSSL